MWASAANDLWVVGSGAVASTSTAGSWAKHSDGSSWRTIDLSAVTSPLAMWGSASDDVWVVGYGPTIAHWDGSSWSSVPVMLPGLQGWLSAIDGSSANDVWAVGRATQPNGDDCLSVLGVADAMIVDHWDGTSWTISTLPPDFAEPSSVFVAGPDDVWIGSGFSMTAPHWNGASWQAVQVPLVDDRVDNRYVGVWGIRSGSSPAAVFVFTTEGVRRWIGADFSQTVGDSLPNVREARGVSSTDLWATQVEQGPCTTIGAGSLGSSTSCAPDGPTHLVHWDGNGWDEATRVSGSAGVLWALSSQDVWFAGDAVYALPSSP